ncbi:MAG: nicotinate-nucleotide adenylyltransferase [Actinomycetia bacterium]|nr:nicotinate-nucleotide adenylyltransferase [Actinomycetes bacterium]MCG2818339.1 nicotinate-nucleotide adenylyltransferase [Actinomycetes bacterium]
MKLGVMGGTFDPIHIGHLVIAEEARHRFGLDHVVFIPSARPPHKTDIKSSPPGDRLRMVQLAIEGNENLSVSDMEIERKGLSYTVDTLHELHRVHGADTELFFITGADALLEILTWKEPGKLLSRSRFIVATRPCFSLENVHEALPKLDNCGRPSVENVLKMEIPALDISSTGIRERAADGRPFRYLVPEPVWSYIVQEELYKKR